MTKNFTVLYSKKIAIQRSVSYVLLYDYFPISTSFNARQLDQDLNSKLHSKISSEEVPLHDLYNGLRNMQQNST